MQRRQRLQCCERQPPSKWRVAKDAFERLDFSTAAEALLVISGRGNLYMEEQAPWGALKKVPACGASVLSGV